jgi:hypothetical protein
MTCGTELVGQSLVAETRVLDGGWVLGFCSGSCANRYDVRGRSVPLDPDSTRTDRRGVSTSQDGNALSELHRSAF